MELDRRVLLRDGTYLLIIEGILIWILSQPAFTISMALVLIASYMLYAIHVIYDSRKVNEDKEKYEGIIQSGKIAWTYVIGSVASLTLFCHYLARGIDNIASIANWPVYLVAVTIGAAATSLPDTILSVKSAKAGEGDDAVANAIGSNIFDISGATALPILMVMLYMLFNGQEATLPIEQSSGLAGLRYFVWGTSALVVGILTTFAKKIDNKIAYMFFGIYGAWITYLIII
jgi:Ca2+/Na+ antiporter